MHTNNTQPIKKNNRLRKFIVRVIFLIFIVYFSASLLQLQSDLNSKKIQLAELQDQITQQKIKNEDLERILSSDADSEYIERIARERLGLGLADERVYVVISDDWW